MGDSIHLRIRKFVIVIHKTHIEQILNAKINEIKYIANGKSKSKAVKVRKIFNCFFFIIIVHK